MTTSTSPPAGSPTRPPAGEAQTRLGRIIRAILDECTHILVPAGGWTPRSVAGRVVLGLLAVSGTGGLLLVGSLVLLKERRLIARAIGRAARAMGSRRHPAVPVAVAPPVEPAPAPEAPAPEAPVAATEAPAAATPDPPEPVAPPAPGPTRRGGRRRPAARDLG